MIVWRLCYSRSSPGQAPGALKAPGASITAHPSRATPEDARRTYKRFVEEWSGADDWLESILFQEWSRLGSRSLEGSGSLNYSSPEVVVVLVSVNRLSALTLSYVAPNQFLRWVDLINMLPLPCSAWPRSTR